MPVERHKGHCAAIETEVITLPKINPAQNA
jgi:hypothetical protein